MMKPLLKGSQISLRAVEPEDLDLMYRVENDTTLWPHGDTTAPYSRYALRRYLEQSQCDAYADHEVRLVISTHQGHDIGFADLYQIDPRHHRAEIGLAILAPYRGLGYAHEALQLLCRYARYLQLHQVYAIISTHNHQATHLFQQSPFSASAILPQWLYTAPHTYADATLFTLTLSEECDVLF